jgi:hypothetical protein
MRERFMASGSIRAGGISPPCSADRTMRLWDVRSIAGRRVAIWRDPPSLTVEQLLGRVMLPPAPGVDHLLVAALDTVDAVLPLGSYQDIDDTYRRLYPEELCQKVPALNKAGQASILVLNILREQARREHDDELRQQCERTTAAVNRRALDHFRAAIRPFRKDRPKSPAVSDVRSFRMWPRSGGGRRTR